MAKSSSKMARRLAATLALAGTFALAMVVGPAQAGGSAGGGDGNWPRAQAFSMRR